MPGPITYAAITLLARDRIGQIRRALEAKKAAGTARELELHVLHLATQADEMMKASQPVIEPPLRLYGPPLTDHVSRFTLLGAVGPDLPRYAAYFAPGQRWLFDTLHKGSPDTDREHVLANSTNLIFDFWRRVNPLIDNDTSNTDKRKEAKAKMAAYVLGHVCHIAADVLAHPYFEAIEARLAVPAVGTTPAIRVMTRDDVAGAFDVQMSQKFFSRGTDTRTKQWADWFPTPGDVPGPFGQAMSESIALLYSNAPKGMPAFDEAFGKIDPAPPGLSPGLIRESIDYFRTIIEIERVWTLGDWMGATAAMFLPMVFAYFAALALPLGKDLDRVLTPADGEDAEDQRRYEAATLPLAMSSLGPLVTMIIVSASGRGLRAEGITGWIHAGLAVVQTIVFFATLGGGGAARWILLFILPIILSIAQVIFVFARGAPENSRMLLYLGPIIQIGLMLIFMLFYHVWLHDGVEEFNKPSDQRDYGKAIGYFVAWLAIVVALWIIIAVVFRYAVSKSVPDDQNDFANGEPRKFLRLYDDMALVHDLQAPANAEQFAHLNYPPARRPILKLWFEPVGATTLQIRIDRNDRLVFKWPVNPTRLDRTVFAPLAPITIENWGALLAVAITDDASVGTLHVKAVREDEKTLELAPGALFSDHGDVKGTVAEHDTEAGLFKDIGTSEAAAFTLFHTPRSRLAIAMGRTGAAPDLVRAEQAMSAGTLLTFVSGRQYTASNATDGTRPFLRRLLLPGDIIEIASAPPERRVVDEVLNDTDVIVVSPFTAIGAGMAFKRVASDRRAVVNGASNIQVPAPQVGILPTDVEAVTASFPFSSQLRVGDTIQINTVPPQQRVVVAVKDAVAPATRSFLTLDAVLAPIPAAPVSFQRNPAEDEDGFPFFADPDDVFGDGRSVMNDAADLGALLCIAAASRMAENNTPVTPAGANAPVHRVSQVFRNWNLDRRRVNEWKMMVSGGAESERRGDFLAADEAAPIDPADAGEPAPSADLITKRRAGEATVRELGWLGAFRSWIDVASHVGTDTTADTVFRPGTPSNRDLTRAIAYLFDAPPAATP